MLLLNLFLLFFLLLLILLLHFMFLVLWVTRKFFVDFLTFENEITTLSQNVRLQSPTDAAPHPRMMETSTSHGTNSYAVALKTTRLLSFVCSFCYQYYICHARIVFCLSKFSEIDSFINHRDILRTCRKMPVKSRSNVKCTDIAELYKSCHGIMNYWEILHT